MTDAKPVEVGEIVKQLHDMAALLQKRGFAPERLRQGVSALLAQQVEIARLTQENERLKGEWKRECDSADRLLSVIGLAPAQYRTEGGSLMVTKAANAIKEARRDE